ncbi:AAA family ATPase [Brachyspira innocens]|uniref:AAA family ATPase n=1 Tax=Brachyspira innocens TaxID=13264 RepID=UPI0026F30770|nr:AAA family ATPase [Brachyspira innocens]
MRLKISNFAKIEEADIKIDGITVICGDNDTGKSTIGKILFSIFSSNYNSAKRIRGEKGLSVINNIAKLQLRPLQLDNFSDFANKCTNEILDTLNIDNVNINNIKNIIIDTIPESLISLNNIDNVANDIFKIMSAPYNKLMIEIINRYFSNIFCKQIDNLFNKNANAKLELEVKKQKMNIEFKNNECTRFDSEFNITHSIFYIDNPFILDNIYADNLNFISSKLISNLVKENLEYEGIIEAVTNREILEKVYDVLNSVMNAEIINKNNEYYLHYNENNTEIKLENLSAGLKSFVIIKRLLENGSLNEKDVLILDEPEIHLHPKWQLIYAELIVLLQKYFNLTITITTHSHYFLEAINRFSKMHNIDERVNFYITELAENKCNVVFKNVNDNLDIIYEKMYEPLEMLSNMREEQDNERNNP